MSLVRPNVSVTIDGRTRTAAQAALVWAEVDLAVGGAHDAARVMVRGDSDLAFASPGSTVAIAMGDSGSEEDVFTGELSAPLASPDGCILEAYAATVALSRTFKSQTYVGQSVAEIVHDLASSVSVDRVDAALQLGVYYADNGRSVWSHLQALAELADADLGATAAGALRFVAPTGELPVRLRFGAELLDWSIAPASVPPAVDVAAHGAGSEAGANKWHWVLHDPIGAGGDPARVVGAIATRDAAGTAGRAAKERAKRGGRRGSVVITGDASIRPGDVVELADLPGGDPGPLHVVRVRHRLDARSGFVTRLSVEQAAGGLSL